MAVAVAAAVQVRDDLAGRLRYPDKVVTPVRGLSAQTPHGADSMFCGLARRSHGAAGSRSQMSQGFWPIRTESFGG